MNPLHVVLKKKIEFVNRNLKINYFKYEQQKK